jgi:hypothetical protein
MRLAFPATEYDEVFLGYQPGQMVKQWENQHFEDKHPDNKDRDGLWNIGFFTAQPFDPADRLRKLHHIHTWLGTSMYLYEARF